jgi:hypothetical protein
VASDWNYFSAEDACVTYNMSFALSRDPTPLHLLEGDVSDATRDGRVLWQRASKKLHAVAAFKSAAACREPSGPSALAIAAQFGLVLALGLSLNTSLELITQLDPGCGTFVSVLQYCFVVCRSCSLGSGKAGGGRSKRLRTYAMVTAANTGSTILWNLSNKVSASRTKRTSALPLTSRTGMGSGCGVGCVGRWAARRSFRSS